MVVMTGAARRSTNVVGAVVATLCAANGFILFLPGDVDRVAGALVACGLGVAMAAVAAIAWVRRMARTRPQSDPDRIAVRRWVQVWTAEIGVVGLAMALLPVVR
jgi:hypothetical protein